MSKVIAKPTLPQDDNNAAARQQRLQQQQTRYQYNYEQVPGIATTDVVPPEDQGTTRWTLAMLKVVLRLIWNNIAVNRAERWGRTLRVFKYLAWTFRNGGYNKQDFKKTLRYLRNIRGRWLLAIKTIGLGIARQAVIEVITLLMVGYKSGRASKVEDFDSLFKRMEVPPVGDDWGTDRQFADLRVAGPNPAMLCGIQALPDNFSVPESAIQAALGKADSLSAALAEGRLFLLDYALLENRQFGQFPASEPEKYCAAPLALFGVPAAGQANRELQPIAIQLKQQPGADIITPADSEHWPTAKLFVNVADGNYHELVSHLGQTHLVIEAFILATLRQLDTQHPIHVLLKPHFFGTLNINEAAHEVLIAKGGFVDALLAFEISNAHAIAAEAVKQFELRDAALPTQLAKRNVADQDALPEYPYRDDGLLIWQALQDWVSAYINAYYASDETVQADTELAAWSAELASEDGGRMLGVGEHGDGKIGSKDDLISIVTTMIFTASAQHAAVNFPQKNIMSYTPAMPLSAVAKPSEDGDAAKPLTDYLPSLDQGQRQLDILTILGSVHFTELAQYETDYFNDANIQPALQQLQTRLAEIEAEIDQRNLSRRRYSYLKPSQIPQSTNV